MAQLADAPRAVRLARIVGGVVARFIADRHADGVVIMDDGSPAARLCVDWCARELGRDRVRAEPPPRSVVARTLEAEFAGFDAIVYDEEAHRAAVRTVAAGTGCVPVHPVTKTALLLGEVPPEPLLPLGDVFASQIAELAGGWEPPPRLAPLVELAGGVVALDGALAALVDERRALCDAVATLPGPARGPVVAAWNTARSARARTGLVPKLGARTVGIDLFA